ncbi:molybdenum ABC transporter ATP-binding protein [Palleronia abyssalis]|uniref:Sulfate/thiosulfate import ATP-binding protein CysA n=1 Tax=Palleronia abyssalis TaxID=1501240 RepID=A0A2R8BXS2_9RHOB|nr:molybdenum ABC transporter ATP-binding protein [Palleronia abyssalis]SPJ24961.1 Sulfate/thiosulfate import ATP-binding protein CysA [Palleronia abyssalis]
MSLSVHIRRDRPGFTLDIGFDAPGGLTVLFGRSGSGKTSVIDAVAGLARPDAGRIVLQGRVLFDSAAREDLPPERRGLGYIFQEGRLFPHMTVRQNLGYGRRFAARRMDLSPVVEMLGIGHLLDRRPGALSGGEKQRVAIGRALLSDPRMLLADEPMAALDAARKAEILPYFERLRDETDVPILYVSHDAAEVARLATTVVAVEDGRVARIGPAAEVLGDPGVAPTGVRAIGAVIETRIAAHHPDGLTELDAGGVPLFLPHVDRPAGSPLRVRIAAHEVVLARGDPGVLSALNRLPGTISALREGEGPGMIVTLDTPAGRLLVRVTRRSAQAMGLEVGQPCTGIVKTVALAREDVGG